MYYVDRRQIEERLGFIHTVIEAAEQLRTMEQSASQSLLYRFAMERVLHIAIESITDIGSLLIDGFIMREASSYEDIIEVLCAETVFDEGLGQSLSDLVAKRRSLVQQYYDIDLDDCASRLSFLPDLLARFSARIRAYLEQELNIR